MAAMYASADVVAVILAGWLAHFSAFEQPHLSSSYRLALVLCLLLVLTVFSWSGQYTSWRGRSYLDQARTATVAWFTALGVLILLAFFLRVNDMFARTWVAWLALWGWIFILPVRVSVMMILRELRNRGWNHKRVIIVGANDWRERTVHRIKRAAWLGMDVMCVVDHDPERHRTTGADVPV